MSLGKSIFGVPIGRPTFESITAPISAKAQELRTHANSCEVRAESMQAQINSLQVEMQALFHEGVKSHALACKLEGVL